MDLDQEKELIQEKMATVVRDNIPILRNSSDEGHQRFADSFEQNYRRLLEQIEERNKALYIAAVSRGAPRRKDPRLPQAKTKKRRAVLAPRPPLRTAPTAAHRRAPSPDVLCTNPAAVAGSRTTAACDARSTTGRWAGTSSAAFHWLIEAWRRWKPKQRTQKERKEGRRQKKMRVAAVRVAVGCRSVGTEAETSAPSASRTSTIPSSVLRRGSTAHTASTGRAWRSCGKGVCSRRVRCAARSCRTARKRCTRTRIRYTSRSIGVWCRAMV